MVQYNTDRPRLIIRDWAKGNLAELIKQNVKQKTCNFVFELESYKDCSIFDELLDALKQNNIEIEDCGFLIETPLDNTFSHHDWQSFREFDTNLKKHGAELSFKEITVVWSMDEVENANQKIQQTIDEINSANLSPLEQLLKAFKTVSNRKYTSESPDESFLISRSLYGIFNSDRIVCVGYSNWLAEIVSGLENPNLVCEKISTLIKDEKDENNATGHASNMIYIKDEKYGIDGLFYADACFSSSTHESADPDLAYFLLPIDDLKHHKSRHFEPRDESPYFCFLSDSEPNYAVQPYTFANAQKTFSKIPQLKYDELREQFANNLLEKSSAAIVNMHKKTEELRQIIFDEVGFDAKISNQTAQKLLEVFDARVDGKMAKDEFKRQLKTIVEQIKTENSQDGTMAMHLLGEWKDKWIQIRQDSYKKLSDSLTIRNGVFAGQKMELRFLQYFATAIKSNSKVVTAETMAKAYLTVLQAEGYTEEKARQKINDILNKSITYTQDSFNLPACTGDFAGKATKRLAFRQEFREKHERAKKRREERQKQQNANQKDSDQKNGDSTDTTTSN